MLLDALLAGGGGRGDAGLGWLADAAERCWSKSIERATTKKLADTSWGRMSGRDQSTLRCGVLQRDGPAEALLKPCRGPTGEER